MSSNQKLTSNQFSVESSSSKAQCHTYSDVLLPEDIAADCFPRLFDENPQYARDECYQDTSYARSPIVYVQQQPQQILGSSGYAAQKHRHKSPSNRLQSFSQQLSKDGFPSWSTCDSVRKTKSTALPAVMNTMWPRNATASSPEFKVDDQRIMVEPMPLITRDEQDRRVHAVRTMCYYNFRLVYIILNCFLLITGFVHVMAGITLLIQKDSMQVVVGDRVFATCIICLFGTSVFLLIIASSGLSCTAHGPKTTTAYAGCSLLMTAIIVSLAFLQSTSQSNVESDAELLMFKRVQSRFIDDTTRVWDYFHETFKCCGVKGYLDWCEKVNGIPKLHAPAGDFLGSFTCNLPESCCTLGDKMKFGVFKNINFGRSITSCVVAPTPYNTHRSGCLTSILFVISYLGKIYRVTNFITAVILLFATATSMILFAYL